MRKPAVVGALVASTLLVATSAFADIYQCLDGRGRPQYQNAPCGDALPLLESQPPSTLRLQQRAQGLPLSPGVELVPPPPPSVAVVPGRTAASTPVDTRQFGLLSPGMSESRVAHTLGPPDQVLEAPLLLVRVRIPGGGVAFKEKRRTTWVYAGDSQILRTLLVFEDGALVAKQKGR